MALLNMAEMNRSPLQLMSLDIVPEIMDFSSYARTGVRGAKAAESLIKRGFLHLPEQINQVVDTEHGSILRLSASEYWLIAHRAEERIAEFDYDDGLYPIACEDSHACLVLNTVANAELMAKLCAVDLRENRFPIGSVVQTVAAGVNVIVAHHKLKGEAVFTLLCDRSVAHYLYPVLVDAMQEFISD